MFSKFITFHTIPNIMTTTIEKAARKWLRRKENKPLVILTDEARQFIGKQWKHLGERLVIQMITTSPNNPEGNQIERSPKELGRCIKAFCYNQHSKWPTVLTRLAVTLNTTRSRATGEIPHQLQGVSMPKPPSMLQLWTATGEETAGKIQRAKVKLEVATESRKRYQQAHKRPAAALQVGQMVRKKTN